MYEINSRGYKYSSILLIANVKMVDFTVMLL